MNPIDDNMFEIVPERCSPFAKLYEKTKTKDFKILNKNGKEFKMHSSIIEEPDFEFSSLVSTVTVFKKKVFNLDKAVDNELLQKILFYIYFQELREVPLTRIFDLAEIVNLLYSQQFMSKIFYFVNENINSLEKVNFILFNALNMEFPESKLNIAKNFSYQELISQCFNYYITNSLIDNFCNFLVFSFLKPLRHNTIPVMLNFLSYLDNHPLVTHHQKVQYVSLFLDHYKSTSSKDRDEYIKCFIKMSITLENIDPNKYESYYSKYTSINDNPLIPKYDLETMNLKYSQMKDMLSFEMNFTKKLLKEKIKTNEKMKAMMASMGQMYMMSSGIYDYLTNYFGIEFSSVLIYDSSIHGFDQASFEESVPGNSNLLFIIETSDSIKFGSYYSIEYPKNTQDKYYKDKDSFIIDFINREIFNANPDDNEQLRTLPNYILSHGYHGMEDGIILWDRVVEFGKLDNTSFIMKSSCLFCNETSIYKEVFNFRVLRLQFN